MTSFTVAESRGEPTPGRTDDSPANRSLLCLAFGAFGFAALCTPFFQQDALAPVAEIIEHPDGRLPDGRVR
jgi:hypothetical protein